MTQDDIQVVPELRSLLRDLIPELMLSQKRHIHARPIGNGSGVMRFQRKVNKLERKEELCAYFWSYVVSCTVTDWPFNTQASFSNRSPSAWIHFLTRVTRELETLRSIAALLMLLAAPRIRCSSSSLLFTLRAYTIVFM